jgi:single-stranded-DNA-specific exonuclease
MPSGAESFVSDPRYAEEFAKARELLLSTRERWRVVYHYDGDGIASATCAVRALRRLGLPVQATPLQGVERPRMEAILRATRGPVLIVDTGASWLSSYPAHPKPVVVLDHHTYPPHEEPLPPHVALVNPLDWGVDGMSELCAATLTWLATVFLDERNWDNAPWGLSGAIADRQHVGGFHGLNRRLVEDAERRGFLVPRSRIGLSGATVLEAVENAIDPYFRGLSGDRAASERFLRDLGLEPDARLDGLAGPALEKLASELERRMREQGVRPEFIAQFRHESYDAPGVGDTEELSELQNATGRATIPGVGIALGLGDPSALERARTARTAWRQGVLRGLRRLETDGVHDLPHLQWFESPDATLAGTQAGLGITYLLDPHRPVAVFTPSSEGLKISTRGTLWLVSQGLDLARVCRDAAKAAGGEGGGHRVAAGATIHEDRRDIFLSTAERILSEQLVAEAA